MNKVDPTKKIQFTMEVATDTLEFLDVKLKFDKESKQISVDVFGKDTDSFTYVLLTTYFPKTNIETITVQNDDDIDKVSCEREKYWQAQLFTLRHGLKNANEWYALNRRGYKK